MHFFVIKNLSSVLAEMLPDQDQNYSCQLDCESRFVLREFRAISYLISKFGMIRVCYCSAFVANSENVE